MKTLVNNKKDHEYISIGYKWRRKGAFGTLDDRRGTKPTDGPVGGAATALLGSASGSGAVPSAAPTTLFTGSGSGETSFVKMTGSQDRYQT